MSRKWLAVVGLILFVAGIAGGLWLWRGEARAAGRDRAEFGPIISIPAGCPAIVDRAVAVRRVMAENESQALRATVVAGAGAETCEATVTLNAPNFNVGPDPEQTITLRPGAESEAVWIISPEEAGTFAVAANLIGITQVVGITVTNVLGLTALQAQILSMIGSVLGPMLTVPWWYEQWQKWQEKEEKEEERPGRGHVPFE